MRLSEFKNSTLSRGVSIGTWISIGHPDVTEMLAHQGFDWLVFDLEHGPLTIESLQRLLQSMNGSGRHDVLPGMAYAHDAATARAYIDQGFRLVGVGSDDAFLMDGSRRALDGLGSLR